MLTCTYYKLQGHGCDDHKRRKNMEPGREVWKPEVLDNKKHYREVGERGSNTFCGPIREEKIPVIEDRLSFVIKSGKRRKFSFPPSRCKWYSYYRWKRLPLITVCVVCFYVRLKIHHPGGCNKCFQANHHGGVCYWIRGDCPSICVNFIIAYLQIKSLSGCRYVANP